MDTTVFVLSVAAISETGLQTFQDFVLKSFNKKIDGLYLAITAAIIGYVAGIIYAITQGQTIAQAFQFAAGVLVSTTVIHEVKDFVAGSQFTAPVVIKPASGPLEKIVEGTIETVAPVSTTTEANSVPVVG